MPKRPTTSFDFTLGCWYPSTIFFRMYLFALDAFFAACVLGFLALALLGLAEGSSALRPRFAEPGLFAGRASESSCRAYVVRGQRRVR